MKKSPQNAISPHKIGSRHYDKKFIQSIVNQRENGESCHVLARDNGVPKTTIETWMRQHGSVAWHKQKKQSFTALQKRTIVRAVLQGALTERAAMAQYGIKGHATIRHWRATLLKNGDLSGQNLLPLEEQVNPSPSWSGNESAEIKALKKALAEAQLKVHALETLVDVAEDMFKIDIRKKLGARQSPK